MYRALTSWFTWDSTVPSRTDLDIMLSRGTYRYAWADDILNCYGIKDISICKTFKRACTYFLKLPEEKSIIDILFEMQVQWTCLCSAANQRAYEVSAMKLQALKEKCLDMIVAHAQTTRRSEFLDLCRDQLDLCRLVYESCAARIKFLIAKYVHEIAFKSSAILHKAGHTHRGPCPYSFLDDVNT